MDEKWIFPRQLVEHWLESQTVNYPKESGRPVESKELLVVSGSDDLSIDRWVQSIDHIEVFSPLPR